jgi:succinate dehydrogenase flavin-adding protein (antitoxin of CptAB toxin-antitoxin module)
MRKKLENRNNFIKKLIYRSKYTGTRETDILLGDFADNFINNLNDDELLAYQKLLDSGDPRIWRLSIDIETTNSEKEKLIVQMIKKYKGF